MHTDHLVRASVSGVIEAAAGLTNDPDGATIRLIAASPASIAAREIWRDLERLAEAKCVVRALFAELPNTRLSDEAIAAYVAAFGEEAALNNVRVAAPLFARKGRERLVLGEVGVWTGDTLCGANAGKAPDYILPAAEAGLAIAASRLAFDQAFRTAARLEFVSAIGERKRA